MEKFVELGDGISFGGSGTREMNEEQLVEFAASMWDQIGMKTSGAVVRLVADAASGAVRGPVRADTLGSLLASYGYRAESADELRQFVAEVNTRVAFARAVEVAGDPNSLPVRLASAFARAVESGRLPKLSHYSFEQAKEFVVGATAGGDVGDGLTRRMAAAHNVSNTEHGSIQSPAMDRPLVDNDEMTIARVYMGQLCQFVDEELVGGRWTMYPVGRTLRASLVEALNDEFPRLTFELVDKGTEVEHVFVQYADDDGSPDLSGITPGEQYGSYKVVGRIRGAAWLARCASCGDERRMTSSELKKQPRCKKCGSTE